MTYPYSSLSLSLEDDEDESSEDESSEDKSHEGQEADPPPFQVCQYDGGLSVRASVSKKVLTPCSCQFACKSQYLK